MLTMNSASRKLLLPLALIAVLGCHHGLRTRNLEFTVAHDQVAQTATVTCTSSTTGKCRFAFTGDVSPVSADLQTGDTVVFHNVTPDTQYCAEVHQPSLNSCKKSRLPEHQSTESRSSQSDAPSN
jgi:hypothetical protein